MKLQVTVDPNPFTSEINVVIQSNVSSNIMLWLTDYDMNLVRMVGCHLHNGENKIFIKNLYRYAVGNYKLEVKLLHGELLETIELIKQ